MKKINLWLLCAALCLLLLAFAGCGSVPDEREFDYLVTFDYNTTGIEANCTNQYLGVMDGGKVGIEPGYSTDFKKQEVPGYYLEGWYTAKTDENGSVCRNDAGRVLLDRRWNFASDTVSGDMTLYANLIRQPSLRVVDRTTGEVVSTYTGLPGSTRRRPSDTGAPKKDGWTFLEYYADAACTTPFTWPYTFGEEDVTVYADFLEGSWFLVRDAATFNLGVSSNLRLYLLSDIDFSDSESGWVARDFRGEINGNGHTLRGITLDQDGNKEQPTGYGLFKSLRGGAYIHDVTFEDVRLTFTARFNESFRVAPFAAAAEEGVRFARLTVSGTLTYNFSGAPTSEVFDLVADDKMRPQDVVDCQFSGLTVQPAA